MNATSKMNSTQYCCAKFKEYVTQLHKYFHPIVGAYGWVSDTYLHRNRQMTNVTFCLPCFCMHIKK